jgi:hypothetical protein
VGAGILVAAIARNQAQSRHGLVNLGMIGFGERKTEQLQIILAMLADAKARTDDDAAHGRLIEDIAAGDIGYVSFLV